MSAETISIDIGKMPHSSPTRRIGWPKNIGKRLDHASDHAFTFVFNRRRFLKLTVGNELWEFHRGSVPDALIIEFDNNKESMEIPCDKLTVIHRHEQNDGKPGKLLGKFPVWIPPII